MPPAEARLAHGWHVGGTRLAHSLCPQDQMCAGARGNQLSSWLGTSLPNSAMSHGKLEIGPSGNIHSTETGKGYISASRPLPQESQLVNISRTRQADTPAASTPGFAEKDPNCRKNTTVPSLRNLPGSRNLSLLGPLPASSTKVLGPPPQTPEPGAEPSFSAIDGSRVSLFQHSGRTRSPALGFKRLQHHFEKTTFMIFSLILEILFNLFIQRIITLRYVSSIHQYELVIDIYVVFLLCHFKTYSSISKQEIIKSQEDNF